MLKLSRRELLAGAIATGALAINNRALAGAEWPQAMMIKWLIGLPPGGGADAITRAIADRLSKSIGQSVVIENRAGANQTLATHAVAQAEPDGYSLVTFAGPTLYSRPVSEIDNGLDAVSLIGRGPMILAGTTKRPTPDLKSLIQAAKDDPSAWSFASPGHATAPHIVGELFNKRAGTKINHVAYRGGGQSINDAIAGHVPLIIIGPGPSKPHIDAGLLRPYAVTTKTRYSLLPDVPTFDELGFPDFDLAQWNGVKIRSGTDRKIVDRMSLEINRIVQTPEMKDFILNQGLHPVGSTPEEFAAFYRADKSKWSEIVRELGITLS